MAIDPNPSSDEILKLCNEALAVVEALQGYLGSGPGKSDPAHDALFLQEMTLLREVRRWSGEGIRISGQGAGAAVDEINQAVSQINVIIQQRKQLAHDLGVIAAFTDLALAISSGNAGDIVSKGRALIAKIKGA